VSLQCSLLHTGRPAVPHRPVGRWVGGTFSDIGHYVAIKPVPSHASCVFNIASFSEVWYTLAVMSTLFATPIHDDSVPPRSLSQGVMSLYGVFHYMQFMCISVLAVKSLIPCVGSGTEPFCFWANLLPGTFAPLSELAWKLRSQEHSLPGILVPC